VPDVSNINDTGTPNIHTSSRIAVARSTTGAFGPFAYLGTLPFTSGYMSDPDVVIDGANRYLVWADGDGETCGGFKSAKLNTDMRTFQSGTTQTLVINGLSALGNCVPKGSSQGVGRPYVEGASLYKRNFGPRGWTLIFAVKPTSVPAQCQSGVGGPNTSNEAIAWASADSAQGPYSYEGIIMCGSTTEWTNQATITVTSNGKMIIIYHDSPANIKERKLHADCLFHGYGVIAGVYRQPLDADYGFNHCTRFTVGDSYKGLYVRDPQQLSKPTLMSYNNGDLKAARYAVGPWERFSFELVSSPRTYAIRSLGNNRYLCSSSTTAPLQATCTSASGAALFEWVPDGPQNWLKSVSLNRYVNMNSDGRLVADLTTTSGAARFQTLSYLSAPMP
jgi:hypothetical protein